ncbi:MAG: bacillithiol system redox-active protein YtxJ [Bacteroidetes bacterium]|nr:MAG: bacillithiol system redox-active protein YtxJ [Bacteroidota bacterium]
MNWNKLAQIEQLIDIDVLSHEYPVLLFKHSTSCSISAAALNRLERNWNEQEMEYIKPYYLDLLAHRTTSNAIADHYEIKHESPQVLIIKKGACIYHESHMGIDYKSIAEVIQKQLKQ